MKLRRVAGPVRRRPGRPRRLCRRPRLPDAKDRDAAGLRRRRGFRHPAAGGAAGGRAALVGDPGGPGTGLADRARHAGQLRPGDRADPAEPGAEFPLRRGGGHLADGEPQRRGRALLRQQRHARPRGLPFERRQRHHRRRQGNHPGGGFDASWELDFFGRVRRSVEAADADSQAAAEVRNQVRLTVIADIVRAYVHLRGTQRRLELARQNVTLQQRTLDLVPAAWRWP